MPTVPGTANSPTTAKRIIGQSGVFNYRVHCTNIHENNTKKNVYIEPKPPARRHHRSNSSPIRFSSITHERARAAHNACHYSMTSRFGVCMLMALRRRRRRRQTARRRNGALGAGAFAQSQFPSHCQRRYLCYLSAGVPVVSCAVPPHIPGPSTHDYQQQQNTARKKNTAATFGHTQS